MSKASSKFGRLVARGAVQCLLITGVGMWVYCEYPTLPSDRAEKLISGLAGHSVTIMSILVAAGAILMSIASTRLIRNLVKTGHYHRLVDSLIISIVLFLVSASIGIVALYLPAAWEQCFLAVLSGVFSGGLVNFAHTGKKLYVVLRALHQRPAS